MAGQSLGDSSNHQPGYRTGQSLGDSSNNQPGYRTGPHGQVRGDWEGPGTPTLL